MLGSTGLCLFAGFMYMKRLLRVTGLESCRKDCVAVEWARSQCHKNILWTHYVHRTIGKIEKRGDSYILLLYTYYQDVSIKRYAMDKVCNAHGNQALYRVAVGTLEGMDHVQDCRRKENSFFYY